MNYFSSEDSEDELDRMAPKSILNNIQSNLGGSDIFNKNKNSFSPKYYSTKRKMLIKAKSDINAIKIFKQKKKISNILNFFTFGHDREKYLKLREKHIFPNIIPNCPFKKKVDWKLFYELIFISNNNINLNNSYMDFFDFFNDEKENKFENNLEKYKFKIITDKIKQRLKNKYELDKYGDIGNKNKINIKKVNKLPEILFDLNKDNNYLKNVFNVGISEMDKNRFFSMLINKLKNKFYIYLNQNKYEKRQYFDALRKISDDDKKNKSDKTSKKKKKIKFDNANLLIKNKNSPSEDKKPKVSKNKKIHLFDKRKSTPKSNNIYNSPKIKKLVYRNDKMNILKQRKTLPFKRKNESYLLEAKDINLKTINFNDFELNNINNKKIFLTDDKFELFKRNAKILINDEILFKEIRREYPDYEEELFNLYNNFLLYEKTYDKVELKNFDNTKKYQNYNHNINNFLSLNNKINIPINEKYDINDKIIENAVNFQKIINYLK